MTAMSKRFAPGWALTVTTVSALLILVALGTWQLQKVGPKTDLLARIEAGLNADPIALPLHVDNPLVLEYRSVMFDGVRVGEKAARVFGLNRAGKPGYFIYAPVKRPLAVAVIVNFGWVPMEYKGEVNLPSGPLKVQGTLVRSAVPGVMTPENDAANGIWYTADVHALAAYFGLGTKEYYHFRIFADGVDEPNSLPLGGQVLINISNNHFQYMLTWYGLGLTLVGVYVVFGFMRSTKAQD